MIHCYPCKILLVFDSSHCAFPGCRFFDTSIYRLRARNHIPGVLPRLTPQSAINIPTSSAVSRSRTERQAERDRPNGKRSSERSIPQKSISDTVGKAVLLLFMTAYFVALSSVTSVKVAPARRVPRVFLYCSSFCSHSEYRDRSKE